MPAPHKVESRLLLVVIALSLVAFFCGCKKGETQSQTGQVSLSERGKAVYQTSCTACHNADPRREGALGPAVAGSRLELIEKRVLGAEYPTGYTPKRPSKIMVALPHLKADVPALHAYLSELTTKP